MQPHDVVLALSDLFPKQRDELKGRASIYKQVLEPFSGERLTKAFAATMAKWTKGIAPWPKEIADSAPERSSGPANRVEMTERVNEIQRKLITETLNWLAPEIAAAAKDHGITVGELEGTLEWRWRKPAWLLACDHVMRGKDLPQRMTITADELTTIAENIKRAEEGRGGRYAGTFKPLRAPAIEREQIPQEETA
jgi:hypothetical protein